MVNISIELKCVECGKIDSLELHEIHFKPHPTSAIYFLLHFEDFIVLCHSHHRDRHKQKQIATLNRTNEIKKIGKQHNRIL